jgi:hypothetical protein
MSGMICYGLRINGTNALTPLTYNYYVSGGAISLFVIAVISDMVFKRRKKFFPLMVLLIMSMIY